MSIQMHTSTVVRHARPWAVAHFAATDYGKAKVISNNIPLKGKYRGVDWRGYAQQQE
jgi:hypothetical protein